MIAELDPKKKSTSNQGAQRHQVFEPNNSDTSIAIRVKRRIQHPRELLRRLLNLSKQNKLNNKHGKGNGASKKTVDNIGANIRQGKSLRKALFREQLSHNLQVVPGKDFMRALASKVLAHSLTYKHSKTAKRNITIVTPPSATLSSSSSYPSMHRGETESKGKVSTSKTKDQVSKQDTNDTKTKHGDPKGGTKKDLKSENESQQDLKKRHPIKRKRRLKHLTDLIYKVNKFYSKISNQNASQHDKVLHIPFKRHEAYKLRKLFMSLIDKENVLHIRNTSLIGEASRSKLRSFVHLLNQLDHRNTTSGESHPNNLPFDIEIDAHNTTRKDFVVWDDEQQDDSMRQNMVDYMNDRINDLGNHPYDVNDLLDNHRVHGNEREACFRCSVPSGGTESVNMGTGAIVSEETSTGYADEDFDVELDHLNRKIEHYVLGRKASPIINEYKEIEDSEKESEWNNVRDYSQPSNPQGRWWEKQIYPTEQQQPPEPEAEGQERGYKYGAVSASPPSFKGILSRPPPSSYANGEVRDVKVTNSTRRMLPMTNPQPAQAQPKQPTTKPEKVSTRPPPEIQLKSIRKSQSPRSYNNASLSLHNGVVKVFDHGQQRRLKTEKDPPNFLNTSHSDTHANDGSVQQNITVNRPMAGEVLLRKHAPKVKKLRTGSVKHPQTTKNTSFSHSLSGTENLKKGSSQSPKKKIGPSINTRIVNLTSHIKTLNGHGPPSINSKDLNQTTMTNRTFLSNALVKSVNVSTPTRRKSENGTDSVVDSLLRKLSQHVNKATVKGNSTRKKWAPRKHGFQFYFADSIYKLNKYYYNLSRAFKSNDSATMHQNEGKVDKLAALLRSLIKKEKARLPSRGRNTTSHSTQLSKAKLAVFSRLLVIADVLAMGVMTSSRNQYFNESFGRYNASRKDLLEGLLAKENDLFSGNDAGKKCGICMDTRPIELSEEDIDKIAFDDISERIPEEFLKQKYQDNLPLQSSANMYPPVSWDINGRQMEGISEEESKESTPLNGQQIAQLMGQRYNDDNMAANEHPELIDQELMGKRPIGTLSPTNSHLVKNDGQRITQLNIGDQPLNQLNINGQLINQVSNGVQPNHQLINGGQPINQLSNGGQPINQLNNGGQPNSPLNIGGQLNKQQNNGGQLNTQLNTASLPNNQPNTGLPNNQLIVGGQSIPQLNNGDQPISQLSSAQSLSTSKEAQPVAENNFQTMIQRLVDDYDTMNRKLNGNPVEENLSNGHSPFVDSPLANVPYSPPYGSSLPYGGGSPYDALFDDVTVPDGNQPVGSPTDQYPQSQVPPQNGMQSNGNPSIANLNLGNPTMGDPARGDLALGNPNMGNQPLGNTAMGAPDFGNPNPSFRDPTIVPNPNENISNGNENPSNGNSGHEEYYINDKQLMKVATNEQLSEKLSDQLNDEKLSAQLNMQQPSREFLHENPEGSMIKLSDSKINGVNSDDTTFMDQQYRNEENKDFLLIDKAIDELFLPTSEHRMQQ